MSRYRFQVVELVKAGSLHVEPHSNKATLPYTTRSAWGIDSTRASTSRLVVALFVLFPGTVSTSWKIRPDKRVHRVSFTPLPEALSNQVEGGWKIYLPLFLTMYLSSFASYSFAFPWYTALLKSGPADETLIQSRVTFNSYFDYNHHFRLSLVHFQLINLPRLRSRSGIRLNWLQKSL